MLDAVSEDFSKVVSKEVPQDLAKELSGRLITFGESENMAWGIEVDIPVHEELLKALRRYDFELPSNIQNIKFLTLAPQESLPATERNIRTLRTTPNALTLIADTTNDYRTITPPEGRPYEYIAREFLKVVSTDSDKQRLNDLLSQSPGNEVLIVQGHGGGDPMSIGEQYNDTPRDSVGNKLQRTGNSVLVEELLDRYDPSTTISTILLESCYTGSKKVEARTKPVVYVSGLSSLNNSTKGISSTVFSMPKGIEQ